MLDKLKELVRPADEGRSRVRSTDKRVLSWSNGGRNDDVSLRATFEADRSDPSVRVSVMPWRDFRKTVHLDRRDLDGLAEFLAEVLEERERRLVGGEG